ncbi:hypothetical protein FOZ62_027031, partial [Perkinsus olseni]
MITDFYEVEAAEVNSVHVGFEKFLDSLKSKKGIARNAAATKPINVDAQRVLAIMDDLKGKATFLTLLTHQVLDGLQGEGGGGATELLGLEFVRKFAEQIRLEDLYVMLNTNSDGTFAIQEDNDDVREATERLRRSTSELCRQMKTIPT